MLWVTKRRQNKLVQKLTKKKDKFMKITKSKLKQIIKEELTKAEKKRKKKLKSELDDLEHK